MFINISFIIDKLKFSEDNFSHLKDILQCNFVAMYMYLIKSIYQCMFLVLLMD